jgi:FMN reductase (NADPH)
MNDMIKLLKDRKSIRSFEDKTIPISEKDCIIEAALQAPTAGNQLLYTILDIEDQNIKDQLSVTCDNQPFIAKAPLVLVFLADCRRWMDCYKYSGVEYRKPGFGDALLACEDALIAAQNTVIAAQSLGIGSCYIGDILENHEKVVQLLNLDMYVIPITMLVFGYPTFQQKQRVKPKRFNKKYIVQKNTYARISEDDLREMFIEIHPENDFDYNEYISSFCNRKYMSDFSIEMNRTAEKYLNNFK